VALSHRTRLNTRVDPTAAQMLRNIIIIITVTITIISTQQRLGHINIA
jgi:hypothetical protein